MQQQWITNRRMEGQPIRAGEITLTPVSQALLFQLPGGMGGFTWNRPVGVRVAVPGQAEQFLPVRDVTRLTIWTMVGAMLGVLAIVGMLRRRPSRQPSRQ